MIEEFFVPARTPLGKNEEKGGGPNNKKGEKMKLPQPIEAARR